ARGPRTGPRQRGRRRPRAETFVARPGRVGRGRRSPRGLVGVPPPTGFSRRKDERTLKATKIGDVVDGLLRERTFARGMPIGQLASDWASVVGPRLAAESAPVSLERGVLVVAATTGPWGAQVRFLADQI